MTLIAHAWTSTAKHVLPDTITAEERLAARRLFYLGAHSLGQLMAAAEQLNAPDQADARRRIREELAVFAGTVGTELEGKV